MQVNNTPSNAARTEATQRSQQSGASQAPTSGPEAVSKIRRVDDVQISDAGHVLSGAGPSVDDAKASDLDPSRVDEIRSRILSGAYNSLEMADHVARSLMRSGDL
ncbi:MAG: hypothetical protein ACR2M1_11080 [Gemmatimonadaceae bacterium]